jgi:hypothetical protein
MITLSNRILITTIKTKLSKALNLKTLLSRKKLDQNEHKQLQQTNVTATVFSFLKNFLKNFSSCVILGPKIKKPTNNNKGIVLKENWIR